MRCTAQRKYGKGQCKAYAVKGKDKCRMHGGSTPIKHGLYSKYASTKLAKKIEEIRDDPRLLDLKEAISVQASILNEFLEKHKDVNIPLTAEAMQMLINITDVMGKNIERLNKIKYGEKLTIRVEYLQKVIIQIVEIIKHHVPEPTIREKIARDLGAIF